MSVAVVLAVVDTASRRCTSLASASSPHTLGVPHHRQTTDRSESSIRTCMHSRLLCCCVSSNQIHYILFMRKCVVPMQCEALPASGGIRSQYRAQQGVLTIGALTVGALTLSALVATIVAHRCPHDSLIMTRIVNSNHPSTPAPSTRSRII